MLDALLEAQLDYTLKETNYTDLGPLYRGKVRDVYRTEERLVIITTDRVSAFDVVLGTIPFKGEILNAMAVEGFKQTADIVPNHLLSIPDPNVLVAKPCRAYPIEFVVRGHITGSLWRDYESGLAGRYGIELPNNLRKDQRFDTPILTPTTKAEQGLHDEPTSRQQIIERGLLSERDFDEAAEVAFRLFARGNERAMERNLILVDTKYELGKDKEGRLTLIDEIHTPDSSRYWVRDEYETRFQKGEPQAMLDKENLRGWLIEKHGFKGQGTAPVLTQRIRVELAKSYLEAYRRMIGREFQPKVEDASARIHQNLRAAGLLA